MGLGRAERPQPPRRMGESEGPEALVPLATLLRRIGMPRLRVGSWNVASLFGGACEDTESMRRHRRKVSELVRLREKADAICLQEVRGLEVEAHESGVWLPGWRYDVSVIGNGRAGGVAILLSPHLQEALPGVRWHELELGRIRLTARTASLVIACVCLVPLAGATPASQLHRLRCVLPAGSE